MVMQMILLKTHWVSIQKQNHQYKQWQNPTNHEYGKGTGWGQSGKIRQGGADCHQKACVKLEQKQIQKQIRERKKKWLVIFLPSMFKKIFGWEQHAFILF